MRCPTTGIALERREAPGPSQGPHAPGPSTPSERTVGPWNLGVDRLSQSRSGSSHRSPGASRRSNLSFERDEKRDTAGRPGRPNSKPGFAALWLRYS